MTGDRRDTSALKVRRSTQVLAALVWLALAAGASEGQAQTAIEAGFRDYWYGTATNTPTGEKPESKLWWNDGVWWGSLFNGAANQYRIYRFDVTRQEWTDTGTVLDTRKSAKADVLWDDASQRLYVVSHVFTTNAQAKSATSQWGRLFRYAYDPGTQRYTLESGFPVAVTRGISETLTIARDSRQRLWVTYVEAGKVKVNWSRADDRDWGTPVDLPVPASALAVSTDDISAVVAFGGAYVGVAWSNQRTAETYFVFRRDADAPGVWQPIERVLPGLECSGACADDHLNLKADQYGRVYLATKTSLGTRSDPLAMLAVRLPTSPGTWTSYPIGLVRDHHTRPIILLDEENNRVYAFATSGESGGAVYMKSSALDDIAFPPGLGQAFIKSGSDTTINNATSTKQNVNAATGLLVAASDQNTRYYLHGYLPLGAGTSPPAAPTGLSASAASSTRVNLAWTDASADEDSFSIERASGGTTGFAVIGTAARNATTFSDTSAAAGTAYSYRVRARNTAGFSTYSNTANVTTPAVVVTAPAAPTGLSATAVSGTRVNLAWTDASSNEEEFEVERASGGGAFAPLVAVPADFTSYSDTTVAPGTLYSYRVRARNGAGPSSYSNTASATTPVDQPGSSTPIADITFEGGTLTGAAGADKAVGTVMVETAAPLKDAYSARVPNVASSYLQKRMNPTSDLYVSLYVRLHALPAAAARVVQISNAGTTVGNIMVSTSGRLQLRVGSAIIGESTALAVGQVYRIGIRQKQGNGGNAVIEGYAASADGVFAGAFAATSQGAWTTASDQLRVGATSPSAIDVVMDDIRLDAASMPDGSR